MDKNEKINFADYKSSEFKINSEHRDSQANVAESSIITTAVNWAQPKDYAHEHKSEFVTSLIFLILSAGAAVFFGHYTLQTILLDNPESAYLPIIKIISILVICLIYWLEFTNLSRITRTIKLNKVAARVIPVSGQRWATAVIISLLNITLVTAGVYFQTKSNDKTINAVATSKSGDSLRIVNEHNAEIERLRDQIAHIKSNAKRQWHGVFTPKDKDLIEKLEQSIKDTRAQKNSEINALSAQKSTQLTEVKENLFNVIILKIAIAAIIELIVLMSIIGIGSYWTGIFIEKAEKESRVSQKETKITDQGQNRIPEQTENDKKKAPTNHILSDPNMEMEFLN